MPKSIGDGNDGQELPGGKTYSLQRSVFQTL